MPRYIKCQQCQNTVLYNERLELMNCITKTSDKGLSRNFYYHKEKCWDEYNKQQEFIIQELKEKDELDRVIKDIYKIQTQVPPQIWSMINDLRNGTNRFQKFFKKKYKEGIPYPVIAEAYRMSIDSIKWAKLNRNFRGLVEELRYGLMIMQKKIEDAHRKIQLSKQSKEFSEAKEHDVIQDIMENREVVFKSTKKKQDLSDILGDD